MNSILTDFRFFIEYDSNPFVLFNSKGQIVYLILVLRYWWVHVQKRSYLNLPYHMPQRLLDTKKFVRFIVGYFEFYAINVLYENVEEIWDSLLDKLLC